MEKIDKALLLIDIQIDFTDSSGKFPVNLTQASQMIGKINDILDRRKELGILPVYIGNEYAKSDIFNIFRNNAAIKDSYGSKLDTRLQIASSNYFTKSKGNAFSNPELARFLIQNNIRELYIAGLYAEACIANTVKGALNHKFNVTILEDCLASSTQQKLDSTIKKFKRKKYNIYPSQALFGKVTGAF